MNKRLKTIQDTNCTRVVIKVGTNFICNNQEENSGHGDKKDSIHKENLEKLCLEIASLREKNIEVMLVTSGAVFTGRHEMRSKGSSIDNSLKHRQAYSAIGQSLLMASYQKEFQKHNISVAQLLLTGNDFRDGKASSNIINTINALNELKVVPIVNENDTVATEELEASYQFGENDLLSASCAAIFHAQYLFILTTANGFLYNNERVSVIEKINREHRAQARGPDKAGRGGMRTKLEAAQFCNLHGIHCAILPGFSSHPISSFMKGEDIGTFFPSTVNERKLNEQETFLLRFPVGGYIIIDKEICQDLESKSTPLYFKSIVGVKGDFRQGRPIEILVKEDGEYVAVGRGVANYDFFEIVESMKKAQKLEQTIETIRDNSQEKKYIQPLDVVVDKEYLVMF